MDKEVLLSNLYKVHTTKMGIDRIKKNPLPIMIGHALIEGASVMLILVTSISPEIYQTMLNM